MRSTGRSIITASLLWLSLALLASCDAPVAGGPGSGSGDGGSQDPYAFDPSRDTLVSANIVYDQTNLLPTVDLLDLTRHADNAFVAAVETGMGEASMLGCLEPGVPGVAAVAGAPDLPYRAINGDGEGIFAVDTNAGVLAFGDPAAPDWDYATLALNPDVSLTVTAIAADDSGAYVGTNRGIFHVAATDLSSATTVPPTITSAAQTVHIRHLAVSGDDLYAASRASKKRDSSLIHWDGVTWSEMTRIEGPSGTLSAPFTAVGAVGTLVFVGSEDGIAAGTPGGEFIVNRLQHPGMAPSDSALVNDISIATDDRSGVTVIYAATSVGLWYSTNAGASWTWVDSATDGLPGDEITSVVAARNRVYIARNGEGVAELVWQ